MAKKISHPLIVLVICLGLLSPLFGWWSGRQNTHYLITWLSRRAITKLAMNHPIHLLNGSNDPDGASGITKFLQHHRHAHRVNINFNATVTHLKQKRPKRAAHTMASAFHYLQDALDLSVHFSGYYPNWIRGACYTILKNWNQVLQNRNFLVTYNGTYRTEWGYMKNMSVTQVVRRMQQVCPYLARELSPFRNYLRPGQYGYNVQQHATRPFLKALATMQAGQDRILKILEEKVTDTGLSDVTVNRAYITISVWDHKSIDGDIVQISLNGRVRWNQIRLARQKTNLQVPLVTGTNVLEIKALNEGSRTPNTAALQITSVIRGRSQQQWRLKTGQTGRIRIFFRGY